jgi:iron complex outermembrane receptor protein
MARAAIVMIATLLAASPLAAQATGSISGRAVSDDSATALAGAFISLDGGRSVSQTDAGGRFRIDAVPAGTHTIEVRRFGFALLRREVHVAPGSDVALELRLTPSAAALAAVTVIGTKSDLAETRERLARVPGAVTLIEPAEIQATRQANLKDVLRFTPGVYVQPRFGAADESQISVRGSGLRNNFHARGINLLVNGMPYRNADGFTDFESLELLTTEAIEVYKGANALRYGGSTLGGAINLDTKTGYSAQPLSLFAQGGAFGFYKAQLASGAARGDFDYYASYARTELDGYRDWSDQRRDRVNLHSGYRLGAKLDARSFYFFAHVREHLPGSLTRAEFEANPRQAVPNNVTNRWGRDYDLHHLGVQLRAQLTPNQRVDVSPYFQYRDIDHPIFEVISQISRDYGAEVRYENIAPLGAFANRLTIGFQQALENMDNRQYENVQGRHGNLTRDEKDKVLNLGVYAEDALDVTHRLTAVLGARADYSRRTVDDHFLSNGDQSDRRVFQPISPRAGLLYDVPVMHGALFANASRTVEPPLLLELSSFGNSGGFIDLAAQKAWQYELGARGRKTGFAWELSLYDVELEDEILNLNVQPFPGAPFTVPTYRNSPKTRHYGLEAGVAYQVPGALLARGDVHDHLTTRVAYTLARYRYVDDPSYDGKDIPGAPRHHVNAELAYTHPSGLTIAPSIEWVPQGYYVNSSNTVKNGSWSSLGFRAEWAMERLGLTAFLAGQNLANRGFSASVQVDNAAGSYFEPADARAIYGGLRWNR